MPKLNSALRENIWGIARLDYVPHLMSLALGVGIFFVYFGPDLLLNKAPFLSLPIGDIASEEGAYFHFVQDSWHFPIFSMPNVNLPEGSNLLFAGGVPVFALFAKIFHSTTGLTINLLGLWYLLCCTLQTHSFFFLMRQITDARPMLLALASIAAGVANAFLSRAGHVSLFGQFICIYPVALVLATTNESFRARTILVLLTALTVTSMLIFAYFGIMNTLMFVAGLGSLIELRRISPRQGLCVALLFIVVVVLVAYCSGYFWAAGHANIAAIEGYRVYAFNLGSLFDSRLFPRWWEGAFFLGWGVLALWIVIFATGAGAIRRAFNNNKWIVVCFAALAAYSLSNRVQIFDYSVFEYPLPSWSASLIGMARASGRMFWPIGYLLMAGAFAICAARFRRLGPVMVVSATIVACYQSASAYEYLRAVINQPQAAPFSYVQLRQLMLPFKSVYIFPTLWCVTDPVAYAERIRTYQQIEFVSGLLNQKSNSSIVARKIKDCDAESRGVRSPLSDEIAFYMFDASLNRAYPDAQMARVHCRRFKLDTDVSGYTCSTAWKEGTHLPDQFQEARGADHALDRGSAQAAPASR